MFSEYDDYLKLDFLADYWYDEGVNIASKILFKFEESSWNELLESCSSRTVEWKTRCAETLDLTTHPTATVVLLKLLDSAEKDVILAAADSLRDRNIVQIPSDAIEKLKELADQGSPPVTAVIKNIFAKLNVG